MRVAQGFSDLARMFEGFAFAVERMSLLGLGLRARAQVRSTIFLLIERLRENTENLVEGAVAKRPNRNRCQDPLCVLALYVRGPRYGRLGIVGRCPDTDQ